MVLKLVVDILTDEFHGGMCQDKIVDNVLTVSVVRIGGGGFALNEKEQEHKLEHGMQ